MHWRTLRGVHWRWICVVVIVCGGYDVDMVKGLLPSSPGMDPHGSHALSLLLVLEQKVWGRSCRPGGIPLYRASSSGSRDLHTSVFSLILMAGFRNDAIRRSSAQKCSSHWNSAAEKRGPILFTCPSSLLSGKMIPTMPQCKFSFQYPKTKQGGVFGGHSSCIAHMPLWFCLPVLCYLPCATMCHGGLGFVPRFNQTHEL